MLQDDIGRWLSRTSPDRAVNQCFELPIVLATDLGLQRKENQDRVAALRVSSRHAGMPSLVAVAIADGMGGMRDGAKCATIALSCFFQSLTSSLNAGLERRTADAIAYANMNVHKYAGGKGGATLSAVVLDDELNPIVTHVGDSRVYSFGDGLKVKRLTTDDSLAEAVGGHGRDLLQFVGMGEGIQPHITAISGSTKQLAITTDGIHYIEPATFESVLTNSSGLRVASERVGALARWCGGHDNASSAFIDLPALAQMMRNGSDTAIQVWDPFGSLIAVWNPDLGSGKDNKHDASDAEIAKSPTVRKEPAATPTRTHPERKPPPRRLRPNKTEKEHREDVQLEIHVEQSAGPEETDENS